MMTSLISKSIEELARDFVHEPEQWEAYQDSKTSNSVAWPPEWLLLCQAVEERFGPPVPEFEMRDVQEALKDPNCKMLVIVPYEKFIEMVWKRFAPKTRHSFDRHRYRIIREGESIYFLTSVSRLPRGARFTHVVLVNRSVWPLREFHHLDLLRRPDTKFLELNIEV